MKVGILGSGVVAQQLGLGLIKSGYEVMLGTRDTSKLAEWQKQAGSKAAVGSFADAAKFGEMVVLAALYVVVEKIISMAGKENFAGKIVIDVTNPLKFEAQGQAPKFAVAYPDSAGANIQKWLPDAKVVKAFNIVTAYLMANPKMEEGLPDMLFAGNDSAAKKRVMDIARNWGWSVIDVGDISQSYLLEAVAMLWIRYGFMNNHWTHAFKFLKK